MSPKARVFIYTISALGALTLIYGAATWNSTNSVKFVAYLMIALVASRLKVSLPGITGTMSVNFLFILIGIVDLGFSETVFLGGAAVLAQCFSKHKQPLPVQVIFNLCGAALAISGSYYVYHGPLAGLLENNLSLLLVCSASTYFVLNTVPIATVISLTEKKNIKDIWTECYFWSFPYYLVGAGIAGMVSWLNRQIGWQTSLLALPAVFLIYRSYRLYLGKLEDEKRHVEDMAGLHLRTIEALALAIEAKDHTTHDHLQRVRVYAMEVGKLLNLSNAELEALRAAALLHDIGKLAVPEHIISKPGRLTPEEFEKMKIHPIVGAEILERVKFPYPVVPIVRSHHERWDGSGYPDGLKTEEIPVGARILSAVDCLDALASDRQYRRALPLDEAMARVAERAGKDFDPKVVHILMQHYRELEKMAQQKSEGHERQKLSTDLKIERGAAPATGYEETRAPLEAAAAAAAAALSVDTSTRSERPALTDTNFLSSIAAARQEAQMLFELSHDLGKSLSLSETLSVLSVRLKRMVPYDSIAIYIRRGDTLVPEHVSGDNFRLFASLQVPLGQGLSGWVAQNKKPILNGNPSVEPGYLNDPTKFSILRSALAVPLEGLRGVVGVLALYQLEKDAFTADHLRVLLAISSKVGLSIENALAFQQAESSATTDYLTDLPNARSLFMHLDREIARCKRLKTTLTVMVCDLDGFKQINDRFGHLEGNRVLKLFARSLQGSCREYDYVARMGGDEFVIIAPGLSPDAANARGECLSQLATAAGREVCGEELLSLSIGVSVFPTDGHDAEKLLSEADRRMYIVKQQHHRLMEARGLQVSMSNNPVIN